MCYFYNLVPSFGYRHSQCKHLSLSNKYKIVLNFKARKIFPFALYLSLRKTVVWPGQLNWKACKVMYLVHTTSVVLKTMPVLVNECLTVCGPCVFSPPRALHSTSLEKQRGFQKRWVQFNRHPQSHSRTINTHGLTCGALPVKNPSEHGKSKHGWERNLVRQYFVLTHWTLPVETKMVVLQTTWFRTLFSFLLVHTMRGKKAMSSWFFCLCMITFIGVDKVGQAVL